MKKAEDWLQSFKEQEEGALSHSIHLNNINSLKRNTKSISIASGKGGVGKTSVALKLSLSLSNMGHKVLLVDCDSNLSNTRIKLGLPIHDDFYFFLEGEKTFDECLHKDGNFHLLSGCNGHSQYFEGDPQLDQVIIDLLREQEGEYDFILLDSPAGLSKSIMNLNAYCDHRVFVVNPDSSSITDSYSLIKLLKTKYGISHNHLLVNKVESPKQYQMVVKSLSETVESFLGSRITILGGLKRESTANDCFDKVFLDKEKISTQKNFLRVLGRFTENFGEGLSASNVTFTAT